jgi:hypothetical protein
MFFEVTFASSRQPNLAPRNNSGFGLRISFGFRILAFGFNPCPIVVKKEVIPDKFFTNLSPGPDNRMPGQRIKRKQTMKTNFGVRRHVAALELGDMSPSSARPATFNRQSGNLSRIAFLLALLLASLPVRAEVTLEDFKLTGNLTGGTAAFTLTATAKVEAAHGAALHLLSRGVALTSTDPHQKWKLDLGSKRLPRQLRPRRQISHRGPFQRAVTQSNDWNAVNFRVATSALQPVVLQGLARTRNSVCRRGAAGALRQQLRELPARRMAR